MWILVTALLCGLSLYNAQDEVSLEIRMPPFEVEEEDTYLCTSMPLPEAAMKLKAFEPLSDQDTVHHMLLFGQQHHQFDKQSQMCLLARVHDTKFD